MLSKRIIWIENLRAIAILAVVLGHISNPTQSFIFTWHMPLFFMISGFFLDTSKSNKDFILAIFMRYMPAYFAAMLLGYFTEYAKNMLLDRQQIDILAKIFSASLNMDFTSLENSYGFVLWFLPALFWAKVLLFFLKKYIINRLLIMIVTIIFFGFSTYVNLPFGLDEGLFVLIFVVVGNYLFEFMKSMYEKQSMIIFSFLVLIYFISYLLFGFVNIDLAVKKINPLAIGFSQSTIICLILIYTSFLVPLKSRLLHEISSMSFLIFIIHPYTNNISHLFISNFLNDQWAYKFLVSIILIYVIKISMKLVFYLSKVK